MEDASDDEEEDSDDEKENEEEKKFPLKGNPRQHAPFPPALPPPFALYSQGVALSQRHASWLCRTAFNVFREDEKADTG
jgi:hypothetical protein